MLDACFVAVYVANPKRPKVTDVTLCYRSPVHILPLSYTEGARVAVRIFRHLRRGGRFAWNLRVRREGEPEVRSILAPSEQDLNMWWEK